MRILLLTGFCFFLAEVLAGGKSDYPVKTHPNPAFVENKGQIIDQNYHPNPSVLFLLNQPGLNVQLHKNGFSYDVYRVEYKPDPRPSVSARKNHFRYSQFSDSLIPEYHFHRLDITLEGADTSCPVIASEPSTDYLNYYTTATPPEGVKNVRQYRKVIYQNVYPGIDLEFFSEAKKGFKYNFIIHPGGRIDNIRFSIRGAETRLEHNEVLVFSTGMGELQENIPSAFIITEKSQLPVRANFKKTGNDIYGFSVDATLTGNETLIIDPIPVRMWGTYYGGENLDGLRDFRIDSNQYIYPVGLTMSTMNMATAGVYQVTLAGEYDVFLAKFNSSGIRIWGTYYGGPNYEGYPRMSLDHFGNIFIAGGTKSTSSISTPGSHQPVYGGGPEDGFLVKFDTSGHRIWATYYGGTNDDGLSACVCDNQGHVYICGGTNSTDNISTPGCHQLYFSGEYDGLIAKFDSAGHRIWGTYYGGLYSDGATYINIDSQGKIVILGETMSSDNIATAGAYQTALGNPPDSLNDCFLCRFDTAGTRLWGTYYGGSGEEDAGNGRICTKLDGYIFFCGGTMSPDGISSPGCWQPAWAGMNDAFWAKFDLAGNRIMATYYGGPWIDYSTSITVDDSLNIYLAGNSTSLNNISTPDGYQPVNYATGIFPDGFLAKFNPAGNRIWGTYYGDTSATWITQIAISGEIIYCAGSTLDIKRIASPGAFQTTLYGPGDGFIVKFGDCQIPDTLSPVIGPDSICKPSSGIVYTVSQAYATAYQWTVPAGITIVSGQGTGTIVVDFGTSATSGVIAVRGLNPLCGMGNDRHFSFTVLPRPVPVISGKDTVCKGSVENYATDPGKSNYQWSVSGGMITGGGGTNSVTVSWLLTGDQLVQVTYTDTNNCEALNPSQFYVRVNPVDSVKVTITSSDNNVCEGTNVTFTANPTNPGSNPAYQWKVNGLNVGTNNPVYSYIPSNGDVVVCILTSSLTTCVSNNPATSNQILMTVNAPSVVDVSITASSNPFCSGNPVSFTATPTNPGSAPQYQWKVNGVNTGTNSPAFTYNPSNGDQVLCILTSSLPCTQNNPATSNIITMVMITSFPAGVSISASPNPFCPGTVVNYTAVPSNGGSSPSYQWKVNGSNQGSNSPAFSYSPQAGDSIRCVMTSNLNCVTNNPASSNSIVMTSLPLPMVSFSLCFDSITILSAQPFLLKGGVPLGGTYSGSGVNSSTGYFNPSSAGIGVKTITYSYQNMYSCLDSKTRTITVLANPNFSCGQTLTDIRDGKTYSTVQLGSQCWMRKNLNYGSYISGNNHQQDNCVMEKYCYNDNPANCSVYGGLYQWDELMSYQTTAGAQGLCPPGWHVPTQTEWNILFSFYQQQSLAGKFLQDSIISGFNAKEAGVIYSNTTWKFEGFASIFWTSTPYSSIKALSHGMNLINYGVSDYYANRSNAFAVRCLKD